VKKTIQEEAAKELVHKAITATTPTQAEILAKAAATLNPSVDPDRVQAIWQARFKQTRDSSQSTN